MKNVTVKSRLLRKEATKAETLLWEKLRNSKTGFKIVRQKPFIFKFNEKSREFIADFYCKECKTIIEIDGSSHDNKTEYDQMRTEMLNVLDLEIIRFKNNQVEQNINQVIIDIISFLRERREDVAKRQERGGKEYNV